MAATLQGDIRDPDILCRYGGEEFAVVMSEMHGPLRVTASIGIADLKPDDRRNPPRPRRRRPLPGQAGRPRPGPARPIGYPPLSTAVDRVLHSCG
ncbi:MAG TPA: hypothetical protein VJT31_31225 [Rugosimonospora sp.]|nr:hypothetical protein [Rugosimonospora sp.]